MTTDGLLTLLMIVKDEQEGIARTLASVAPLIDRWAIMDTGSSDRTRDLVRETLSDVPGDLYDGQFTDFAQTRNDLMDLVGQPSEFLLWLDADDEVVDGEALRGFLQDVRDAREDPRQEAFRVRMDTGVQFDAVRLVRAAAGWRYYGAVHEVLMHPQRQFLPYRVPQSVIRHRPGPASMMRTQRRFARDVDVLRAALDRDPEDRRWLFYLASTLHWLERYQEAEELFERRIAAGGGNLEEIYQSKVALARIAAAMDRPWPQTQARWLEAHSWAPHRAEPLYEVAMHYERHKNYPLVYLFARRGWELPPPAADALMVNEEVYTWRLADLVAVSAWHVGEHTVGATAAAQAMRGCPGHQRLEHNLDLYRGLMQQCDTV